MRHRRVLLSLLLIAPPVLAAGGVAAADSRGKGPGGPPAPLRPSGGPLRPAEEDAGLLGGFAPLPLMLLLAAGGLVLIAAAFYVWHRNRTPAPGTWQPGAAQPGAVPPGAVQAQGGAVPPAAPGTWPAAPAVPPDAVTPPNPAMPAEHAATGTPDAEHRPPPAVTEPAVAEPGTSQAPAGVPAETTPEPASASGPTPSGDPGMPFPQVEEVEGTPQGTHGPGADTPPETAEDDRRGPAAPGGGDPLAQALAGITESGISPALAQQVERLFADGHPGREALVAACIAYRDQIAERHPQLAATLLEGLDRAGVRELVADGQRFDPRAHEAFGVEPTDRPELHDVVAETVKRGYADGERIIRVPQVAVYRHDPSGAGPTP
ncbi:hypothetical protein FHS43_006584 [Streptosporangium becharense]|uniref:Nucleotide exchange factor GrpE n=1 Tax=Streptosporangium becharense TaxID=1816182 RepID=A0A7W9IBZ4_9ACTN|nr:nucleotide exchange factor GrpE [Streptosporangium becharense]MBB2915264.1 hypothetical protein [Streptosporangium becharense]MBB5817907.1 hypothetical protein [Streptosporangium becharense]